MAPIAIIGAARTPMGGLGGGLSDVPAAALGGVAIKAALDGAQIKASDVDELLMGCVLPAGQGQAPARQAGFAAGLGIDVPATTVNKMCGSGMKTVMMAHDQLAIGNAEIMVAGGMESMSQAPYILPKMRTGARLGHSEVKDHMFLDGLEDAYDKGRLMGTFAEDCAQSYQFTRKAQDDYALQSLSRALAAGSSDALEHEIAPVTVKTRKGETTVDEDELRAEYDLRIEEFVQPERRLIERLVFSDEAAAQAALDAINADETSFPELVAERGLTLDDVNAGDVSLAEMGDAGPAIFASQNGDVTGPFASSLGPTLYRMNAVLAARNITFEDALPELREDQSAARARRVIEDQIEPITNLMSGGASLEQVAEQTDMVLGELDFTEVVTDGIAAYAAFRETAETQDVAAFAQLADLDDGGLFALEVVEIRAPALIPLEDIRMDVVAGWEAQETSAAIIAAAEAKQAQLNETVSDFTALDLDAVQENAITRRGFINGAPTDFIIRVFEMEIGEVRVLPNDGNAIIVRLDNITPADETDGAYTAEAAAVAETAGEGIAQDIYELYSRAVQVRTDVNINEQTLNAVHSNFR